jgi:hypothetical protein
MRHCVEERVMGSVQIEKRVATLEAEMARLKSQIGKTDGSKPWWERIAGTFQDDPVYAKAMKLGRQYRRSQRRSPNQRKPGR